MICFCGHKFERHGNEGCYTYTALGTYDYDGRSKMTKVGAEKCPCKKFKNLGTSE